MRIRIPRHNQNIRSQLGGLLCQRSEHIIRLPSLGRKNRDIKRLNHLFHALHLRRQFIRCFDPMPFVLLVPFMSPCFANIKRNRDVLRLDSLQYIK